MPYKLTLVDDQGVVLYTWEIGGDDGYPLPVRAMGAADIIATINREIEIDQRAKTREITHDDRYVDLDPESEQEFFGDKGWR
jgi:hypothetical protein